MEEVGFDMKDRAVDDQYLERDLNGQLIRLYIVKHVPLDTKFAPKTKNEIKVRNRSMTFFVSILAFDLFQYVILFRRCVGFVSLIYLAIVVTRLHKLV